MTDPRLCAMIPLVKKVAAEQKNSRAPNGWKMPYDDLYARLKQRTNGRIVKGDGDTAEESTSFKGSIFNLDYGTPRRDKYRLWVELTLDL